jgi:hypothetical protein
VLNELSTTPWRHMGGGGGCIDAHFLHLGTSWRWVVSFTPQPLYPRERAPVTHWIGGWVDPRAGVDGFEKRKLLPPPGLELRPLGRPARSQLLYRLLYPGSSCIYILSNEKFCLVSAYKKLDSCIIVFSLPFISTDSSVVLVYIFVLLYSCIWNSGYILLPHFATFLLYLPVLPSSCIYIIHTRVPSLIDEETGYTEVYFSVLQHQRQTF